MSVDVAREQQNRGLDPEVARSVRRARRRKAASQKRRLRWLAVGLDVAIVAAFGAGYGARYVPPPTAWPVQVVALVLPIASVGVVVAGAAWTARAARVRTRRAWTVAAAHAGLVGLALARYGPLLLPGGAETAPVPETLRVLTLNAGMAAPTGLPLAADIASMVRPDVVALQETAVKEVEGEGRLAADRAALGFLMGGGYAAVRAEGEERLAVLLREDAHTGDVRGGTLDPLASDAAGVMTRVELEWRGRPFALYVVHFRSYGRSGGPLPAQAREVRADLAARAREARLFRQLLDAESLPFIVVGDFNATPDQWTYAHVAAGLHDALVDEVGWAPTFPDERPVVQIDAVLASPEWDVVQAEVLPEGLSDHRGVLVDLRWAQSENGRG